MSIHDTMNLVVGLLQFAVAGYALRLNRVFGPGRVGWSLFSAFALLALLHFCQAMPDIYAVEKSAIPLNVMYSIISILVLIGMAHLESLFKIRLRIEQEEIRLRAGLEAEVQKKTIHLTRAIEELQMEIDERKRMEAEVKSHIELLDASPRLVIAPPHCNKEMLAHIRF